MGFVNNNYADNCKANTIKEYHHRFLDRALVEMDHSWDKYGPTMMREEENIQWIFDKPRYENPFGRWLMDDDFYDEVSKNAEKCSKEGIMVPVEARGSEVQPHTKLTIEDSIYHCDYNDVGKNLSRLEEFRLDFANYLRSDEGQKLMEELGQKYDVPEIAGLAVGLVPEGALMQVDSREGGAIFYRNLEFYKLVETEAKVAGVNVSEYLARNPDMAKELVTRSIMAEEVTHMYRKSRPGSLSDLIKEETETKTSVRDFYARLKKGAGKDVDNKRIYELLESIMGFDVTTTPERYTELYSSGARVGFSKSDIASLITAYMAEALEEGMDETEALEYAASKAASEVNDKAADNGASGEDENVEDAVDNDEEAAEE